MRIAQKTSAPLSQRTSHSHLTSRPQRALQIRNFCCKRGSMTASSPGCALKSRRSNCGSACAAERPHPRLAEPRTAACPRSARHFLLHSLRRVHGGLSVLPLLPVRSQPAARSHRRRPSRMRHLRSLGQARRLGSLLHQLRTIPLTQRWRGLSRVALRVRRHGRPKRTSTYQTVSFSLTLQRLLRLHSAWLHCVRSIVSALFPDAINDVSVTPSPLRHTHSRVHAHTSFFHLFVCRRGARFVFSGTHAAASCVDRVVCSECRQRGGD